MRARHAADVILTSILIVGGSIVGAFLSSPSRSPIRCLPFNLSLVIAIVLVISIQPLDAGPAFGRDADPTSKYETSIGPFDTDNDFSVTNGNPNGVWSYGEETSLGGTFTLFTLHTPGDCPQIASGMDAWCANNATSAPNVAHNATAVTVIGCSGHCVIPPNTTTFHPGPNGEYGLFRFTAPTAGTYAVNVSFSVGDTTPTTTDVHVLVNNLSVFAAPIDGTHPAQAFSGSFTLLSGGTVDFAVGFGADGNYFSDTTLIHGTIAQGCGVFTSVMLSPLTATNPVSTNHTVTATVTDNCGNPLRGVTVHFTVTGSVNTTGTCATSAAGTCSFTYRGPILPGADLITGCAGPSGGPPCGTATKTWVLPVSSPICTIDITDGGWIIADNGDKASFGGSVSTDQAATPTGHEQYMDSPADVDVHSIDILAITCSSTLELADIYGHATVNGSGSHLFRIEVEDPDSTPTLSDTYWITLDTGYDSGKHPLGGGHIEIHPT